MSRLVVAAAAVVVLLAREASAQGFFSHRPLHQPYGYGGRRPGYPHGLYSDYGLEERRRASLPPCPHYQPMRVSDWWEDRRGHVLRATLPGVDARNRRAWLSRDGQSVHISAARPLPPRGRECMPADARVSRDGRHEVFEAVAPVPATADVDATTVREERRGLEVAMPRRQAPRRQDAQGTA
eukprot:CAMPEP_0195078808 /NCGR_PEP_ID=MMETSP0448-20130528/20903_1 /TAXON_ID=66468 /ORGANISM="Heterocapsa triquestra, Strain CCMP 448" /LENGTH=181 /DNA_ID=CAMNT_0040111573 /DNA_START=58 /DNA_END=600 /DNA_ORIENTATION=-